MKKTFTLILVFLICAATVFAGGSSEASSSAAASSASKEPNGYVAVSGGGSKAVYSSRDSIVYRLNADLATIDPHRTNSTGNERIVEGNIYESLFGIDMFNGKTEVNYRLAESYKYLDDAQTKMQINLRKGVKFHNGEEMKADDVVWSLNRAMASGFNEVVTGFIDSVE
ncbi:MAG: hypothetical protein IJ831_06320, partial [Spirochaetales bacterium]|nr:hypothetical protein [Spirochaetales bacterium]